MRALIWSGWKLDIKVEGTEDRIELFIWSAERGGARYVVAADNHVSPLVELQRVTGAQEPVVGIR